MKEKTNLLLIFLYENNNKIESEAYCHLKGIQNLFHFIIQPLTINEFFHPYSIYQRKYNLKLSFHERNEQKIGTKRKEIVDEFEALNKADEKRRKFSKNSVKIFH